MNRKWGKHAEIRKNKKARKVGYAVIIADSATKRHKGILDCGWIYGEGRNKKWFDRTHNG